MIECHSPGYAELAWDYPGPSEYLKHFAVYMGETGLSDVSGMTPVLTVTENSAKIENLANGVTYRFAVTAVNNSGCGNNQVTPVSATPRQTQKALKSQMSRPEVLNRKTVTVIELLTKILSLNILSSCTVFNIDIS